jgi:iron complex outermembrane receptor protein
LEPVKQEQLTAYEVGFKLPLADRAVQINAAGFYYDYRDKQIRGRFLNIFGALERLFNIPRSEIIGVEAQIVLSPFRGLTASANGTYIHSEILTNNDGSDFTNFPSRAHDTASPVPLTGSSFPFTPKYSASADISYDWEVGGRLKASVGSSLTYQGRTRSTLTAADPRKPTDISFTSGRSYNDPTFSLPSYALLDLRASLGTSDGKYTVSVFGRNVTNKYYLSASTLVLDTITTYSGQPATYGVKLAVRY